MNAKCYGHTFNIDGSLYYRCFFDGEITDRAPKKDEECCICLRAAEPRDAPVKAVKTKITADIDLGSIGIVQVKIRKDVRGKLKKTAKTASARKEN